MAKQRGKREGKVDVHGDLYKSLGQVYAVCGVCDAGNGNCWKGTYDCTENVRHGVTERKNKAKGRSEYGKCATYIRMRAVRCGRHGEPRSAAPVVYGAF